VLNSLDTSNFNLTKRLKDKELFDGEDLVFKEDNREFGLPKEFDDERDYDAKVDGWDGWFQNFNWTQYIDGDDIAEEFFSRPGKPGIIF
jgi:hypothetical protein